MCDLHGRWGAHHGHVYWWTRDRQVAVGGNLRRQRMSVGQSRGVPFDLPLARLLTLTVHVTDGVDAIVDGDAGWVVGLAWSGRGAGCDDYVALHRRAIGRRGDAYR